MHHRTLLATIALAASSAASAQDAQPTLEQRVERMEAESEIRRVLIEYGAFLDGRDYASYAQLFADDGVWVGGFGSFTGPAAIEQMLMDNLGEAEPGYINKSSFHMMTNPIIDVDGDRAEVSSRYLFWTRSDSDRPTPALAGRYVDEFVRQGDQWKIARRTTYGVIPYRDPADPAASSAPVESAEARLRKLEDQMAIQRIIVEYAARLDGRDFAGYADLFAKDGVWQNGATVRRGREEIEGLLVGLFGEPPEGFTNMESYHLVSNPQVDVDGDRATARSRHLLIMRDEQGNPRPALTGIYEDEFVREDGEWKILKRVDNPIIPTAEEWRRQMMERSGSQTQ
jgi:uncharacterized protein (TIGR02246 family)